jgi:hypothetical protein
MMPQASENRFTKRSTLKSALPGVSDEAWDHFVRIMSTKSITNVSLGGAIGSFELRPRRLGQIGVMTNLRRGDKGIWEGDLVEKYEHLGRDATQQYQVFALSMRLFDEEMSGGKVKIPPGVNRGGALAILHCGGKEALGMWPEKMFKTTKILFDKTNEILKENGK